MTTKNAPTTAELTTDFHSLLQERLHLSIRKTLIDVLEEEVTDFLQAGKYQRSAERTDHRNGHYTRDLVTSSGKIEDLPVPRTRKGFQTKVFERYQRRQAELDNAIAEMFVKGVSTERLGLNKVGHSSKVMFHTTQNYSEKPMTDILALLQNIAHLLEPVTFRQSSRIIFAMLVISGRITMLGLSHWADKGSNYCTLRGA